LNNEHGPDFNEALPKIMTRCVTLKGYRVIVLALFQLHIANVRFEPLSPLKDVLSVCECV